jgi:hypothetical protein
MPGAQVPNVCGDGVWELQGLKPARLCRYVVALHFVQGEL